MPFHISFFARVPLSAIKNLRKSLKREKERAIYRTQHFNPIFDEKCTTKFYNHHN